MAYTTINKSTDYFNNKIYTGNGSTNAITGVGHQPDLVWIKSRTEAHHHRLFDAVRGATKKIFSSQTNTESTDAGSLTSFDADGFTHAGGDTDGNGNGQSYASWNWKANGAGSANTDGSISSTVSVNTTSGFSISKYTGTGSAGATVGHGLGVAPKMIIAKGLTYADVWIVGGDNLGGWNKEMYLNSTSAVATNNNAFNGVAPTSSVFTLGSGNGTNKSGDDYIAYCFAEKTGYSKFGKLISNGSDDGTFTYTGFAPKFVMLKPNVSDGWSNWYIFDTTRDYPQLNDMPLYANLSTQEGYYGGSPATNYAQIDILSNGFKIRRGSGWGAGGSGTELIYMAFGQSLVGSNNVPCTAR